MIQRIKNILKGSKFIQRHFFIRHSSKKINYRGHNFTMMGSSGKGFVKSLQYYGCYEPFMTDKFIEKFKPNGYFLDVGCADGYYSIFARRLKAEPSRIYGFDVEKYKKNIFHSNVGKQAKFVLGEVGKDILLDDFINKYCNEDIPIFVKIDVLGTEIEIMKTLEKTLRERETRVLIEVQAKDAYPHIDSFCNLLEKYNYSIEFCINHRGLHRGMVDKWRKITTKGLKDICKLNKISEETFALYLEKQRRNT